MKETDSRIRVNYIWGSIVLALSVISVILFASVIITDLFGIDSRLDWNKFTLIVICSISIMDDLSNKAYSLTLLKHLQNIEKSADTKIEPQLNNELEKIILKFNKPYKSVPVIILGALLLTGALLTHFEYNPFWNYFKILLILFYVLLATNTVQNLKKLRSNISQAENQLLEAAF